MKAAAGNAPAGKPPKVQVVVVDRTTRLLRIGFVITAALLLILGAASYQIQINRNAATARQLKAETHTRCLTDTRQDARRRRLDMALIGADRAALTGLRAVFPHADHTDQIVIAVQIRYYSTALAARLADIPAPESPARC